MKASFGITRGLTTAALLGLMVLAMLGFSAQEKDLEGLRQSSKESIYWSSSQAEAELARFLTALGRYSIGDADVSEAEVNKRFDIVWSRIALFEQGDVGRRLAEFDTEPGVVEELRNLLRKHEATILNLSRLNEDAEHRAVLSEFTEAGERLRQLSVKLLAAEEARLASVRGNVRTSARLTWAVSMAALVLALLLIGVMLIETRRYRRMAEESAELAARAEAASRAKSRFLTMMSHELRTPMNGVLGLLALVRQTNLNDGQARLIEQADRSGRQMSALLGDILDFSDLQSESLIMSREMFALRELSDSVEKMFGPIIQREGVSFDIEIAPGAPRWVVGDMARLRQSLGHFVTFLVDVVGTRDVRMVISGESHMVRFDIDIAVQEGDRPGWQPEAIFGRASAEYGEFASDSLGPMIARGLVTLMGGSVFLSRPRPGRAVLSVAVPLETVEGPGDSVHIEAQSITVQTVLLALLKKLSRPIWEPGSSPNRVGAVLMEAGGNEEKARAARMRSSYPSARLIAIGNPSSPDLFDSVCPLPVSAAALGEAISAGATSLSFKAS
ncbi:MAG TPA: histidine kinase dimerization/phospho-acceptor domain-containing protein [Thermohalobaculum sp.]|nr:histidine kinase dimerization/phospho-acceptor domain-containing protein [Thermohalobaculum sp.]